MSQSYDPTPDRDHIGQYQPGARPKGSRTVGVGSPPGPRRSGGGFTVGCRKRGVDPDAVTL
eukprot:765185-Hanusia_phi.AAC.2